ncbi:MAG TPA: serine/threonine-protein kinase [Blastocatellia bacterium]|nr:serine/threonine-protein kinase [Blastocatellia bacterium]
MSERPSPERWQQVEALYHAALEHPPARRAAWLAAHCFDAELRREVESLLAYDEQAAAFIEAPALEVAAREVAEAQKRRAPGQQVGAYKILSQLGVGGMGEVYLAEDTRLNRRVAIKFLPEIIADDPQARRRFLREARAAAALDHPNICAIHEVSEEDGQPFIVMQYVTGETLAARLRRQPLGTAEALDFAIQIVDALADAHAHHIIHRDIKPENIIINARGQVKVLDFGLAKIIQPDEPTASFVDTQSFISAPGAVLGTVPYMSPEQARGEPLDARTDIFSFGAVLYEMISGRSPFAAPSRADTLLAIVGDNPPPLARYADDVPDELQRITAKALRKDREERYQTMRDLLIDLENLRDELALGAAPPPAAAAPATPPATPSRLRRGFARLVGWLKS